MNASAHAGINRATVLAPVSTSDALNLRENESAILTWQRNLAMQAGNEKRAKVG